MSATARTPNVDRTAEAVVIRVQGETTPASAAQERAERVRQAVDGGLDKVKAVSDEGLEKTKGAVDTGVDRAKHAVDAGFERTTHTVEEGVHRARANRLGGGPDQARHRRGPRRGQAPRRHRYRPGQGATPHHLSAGRPGRGSGSPFGRALWTRRCWCLAAGHDLGIRRPRPAGWPTRTSARSEPGAVASGHEVPTPRARMRGPPPGRRWQSGSRPVPWSDAVANRRTGELLAQVSSTTSPPGSSPKTHSMPADTSSPPTRPRAARSQIRRPSRGPGAASAHNPGSATQTRSAAMPSSSRRCPTPPRGHPATSRRTPSVHVPPPPVRLSE
jgi:hypothetical protein